MLYIYPPDNEATRSTIQPRQDYRKYNAHTKKQPHLLPTVSSWVTKPPDQKMVYSWGGPIQNWELPDTVITTKSVARRNMIHIREAAMPKGATKTTTSLHVASRPLQIPARATDIFMIAARTPSLQSIVQPTEAPRILLKPCSQQPTPLAVPVNQQAVSSYSK